MGRDTDRPGWGRVPLLWTTRVTASPLASMPSCGGQIWTSDFKAPPTVTSIHTPPSLPQHHQLPQALNSWAMWDTQAAAVARCNDPLHRSPVPLTNNDYDQSYVRLHCENITRDKRWGMNPHRPSRCCSLSVPSRKKNSKEGHSDSTPGEVILCTHRNVSHHKTPFLLYSTEREFPLVSFPSPLWSCGPVIQSH